MIDDRNKTHGILTSDHGFWPSVRGFLNLRTGICVLVVALALAGCRDMERSPAPPAAGIVVSPDLPADIPGGAAAADIRDAARFAWREFIALNWPAVPQTGALGTRGMPDRNKLFGDRRHLGPLVWQTERSKTEIFPGIGEPHGSALGAGRDYGYDEAPQYVFDPKSVGNYSTVPPGQVPACDESITDVSPAPWVNLSEAHEAGPDSIFAGVAPITAEHGRRILYAVKVNRPQYIYVAAHGWYDGGNPGTTIPHEATASYISSKFRSPPAGSGDLVSFPFGSMEIKSAWRPLTVDESSSGRFHTAIVRYYRWQDPTRTYRGAPGNLGHPCYTDGEWGLISMHIKTKTPSAPYYIWATFEHSDLLLDKAGNPIEDADGQSIRPLSAYATDPPITSRNAVSANPETPDTIQKLSPANAESDPGMRVYYENASGTPTTQGRISVNHRAHPIPNPIIGANRDAHDAIRSYANDHGIPASPWDAYKLVGVQWKPADKPVPGQDWKGDPDNPNEILRYPSIYYLANMAIETSHRLQLWSGKIQRSLPPPYAQVNVGNLITDFEPDGTPAKNVQHDGGRPDGRIPGYNMGGCLGCHGQMQKTGYGLSFIFRRGRIPAPEVDRHTMHTMLEMMR